MNLALNSIEGINASDARDFGRRRTPAEYDVLCAPVAKKLDSDMSCIIALPHRPKIAIVEEYNAGSSVRLS